MENGLNLKSNAPTGDGLFGTLVQRFLALVYRIGNANGAHLSNEAALAQHAHALIAAYQEPHRHYHGAPHLQSCLEALDTFRKQPNPNADYSASALDGIEYALFFHDAIYQPEAKDNEQRSADWAVAVLRAHLAPLLELTDQVHRLIMATRHHGGAPDSQTALLLDIDLSILAADAASFDAYDLGIRAEYHFVPQLDYKSARAAILQRFLDAPQIYHTPFFAGRTQAARANLRRALASLQHT